MIWEVEIESGKQFKVETPDDKPPTQAEIDKFLVDNPSRSFLADVAGSLKHGVIDDFPAMGADALAYLQQVTSPISDPINEFFGTDSIGFLRDYADKQRAQAQEAFPPSLETQTSKFRHAFTAGTRSVFPSLGAMAGGFLAGGPVGAVATPAVLFGLSRADAGYRQGVDEGMNEFDATVFGLVQGTIEGGVEFLGTLVQFATAGVLPKQVASKVLKAAASAGKKMGVLGKIGLLSAGEGVEESVTGAGEYATNVGFGVPNDQTLREAITTPFWPGFVGGMFQGGPIVGAGALLDRAGTDIEAPTIGPDEVTIEGLSGPLSKELQQLQQILQQQGVETDAETPVDLPPIAPTMPATGPETIPGVQAAPPTMAGPPTLAEITSTEEAAFAPTLSYKFSTIPTNSLKILRKKAANLVEAKKQPGLSPQAIAGIITREKNLKKTLAQFFDKNEIDAAFAELTALPSVEPSEPERKPKLVGLTPAAEQELKTAKYTTTEDGSVIHSDTTKDGRKTVRWLRTQNILINGKTFGHGYYRGDIVDASEVARAGLTVEAVEGDESIPMGNREYYVKDIVGKNEVIISWRVKKAAPTPAAPAPIPPAQTETRTPLPTVEQPQGRQPLETAAPPTPAAPVTELETAPPPTPTTTKPSSFKPTDNFFNTPALQTQQKYAWRTMGTKEYNKLIAGTQIYKGGPAKRANYFAPTPDSAAQFGGKGKFLVEFGGVYATGEEGLVGQASLNNVTKVYKWLKNEWTQIDTPTPAAPPTQPTKLAAKAPAVEKPKAKEVAPTAPSLSREDISRGMGILNEMVKTGDRSLAGDIPPGLAAAARRQKLLDDAVLVVEGKMDKSKFANDIVRFHQSIFKNEPVPESVLEFIKDVPVTDTPAAAESPTAKVPFPEPPPILEPAPGTQALGRPIEQELSPAEKGAQEGAPPFDPSVLYPGSVEIRPQDMERVQGLTQEQAVAEVLAKTGKNKKDLVNAAKKFKGAAELFPGLSERDKKRSNLTGFVKMWLLGDPAVRQLLPPKREGVVDAPYLPTDPFYSKLESNLNFYLQGGPRRADQVLGFIRNKHKGSKELEASGVVPYLEELEKKKVSFEEVREVIDARMPNLERAVFKSSDETRGKQLRGSEVIRHRLETKGYRFETDLPGDPANVLTIAAPGQRPGVVLTLVNYKAYPEEDQADIAELIALERSLVDEDGIHNLPFTGFNPDTYRGTAPKDADQTVVLVRVPARKEVRALDEKFKAANTEAEERQIQDQIDEIARTKKDDLLFTGIHFGSEDENVLGWARIQYEQKGDKKIAHIIEVQSDWAGAFSVKPAMEVGKWLAYGIKAGQTHSHQTIFDTEAEAKAHVKLLLSKYIKATPQAATLPQYNRLALKAAIEQALKDGATHIAISDAETTMISEGHDRVWRDAVLPPPYYTSKEAAERSLAELQPRHDFPLRVVWDGGGWSVQGMSTKKPVIKQEGGMRLNYDKILPKILAELTGEKGVEVDLGEHQNVVAAVDNFGGVVPANIVDDISTETTKRLRKDLIFKNPDGTPKTSVTAQMYSLSGVRPNFSMWGADPGLGTEVRGEVPSDKPLEKVSGANLRRLFKSFGANLYDKDLPGTVVKELVQNALDTLAKVGNEINKVITLKTNAQTVRKLTKGEYTLESETGTDTLQVKLAANGSLTVEKDDGSWQPVAAEMVKKIKDAIIWQQQQKQGSIISITDNGLGMSPRQIITKFLPVAETDKAEGIPDDRGEFGIAKIAFLGSPKSFTVRTKTKIDQWVTLVTTLKGTREQWLDFASSEFELPSNIDDPKGSTKIFGMSMSWHPLPGNMIGDTGTEVTVKLDSTNTKGRDITGYSALSLFTATAEKATPTLDAIIFEVGEIGDPDGDPYGFTREPKELQKTFSVKGADIKVYWDSSGEVEQAWDIPVLNRGQFQFEEAFREDVWLPKHIVIDIEATVKSDNPDYPWTINRDGLKKEAKKQVNQFIKDLASAAEKTRTKKVLDQIEKSPKIPGTDLQVIDVSASVNNPTMYDIVHSPAIKRLANILDKTITNAIAKLVEPKKKLYENLTFGGFIIGSGAYGIRLGTTLKGSKGRVFIDPLKLAQHIGVPGTEVFSSAPPVEAFADQLAGFMLHEVAHQESNKEGQTHARVMTFITGSWIRSLVSMSNKIQGTITQKEINELKQLGKKVDEQKTGANESDTFLDVLRKQGPVDKAGDRPSSPGTQARLSEDRQRRRGTEKITQVVKASAQGTAPLGQPAREGGRQESPPVSPPKASPPKGGIIAKAKTVIGTFLPSGKKFKFFANPTHQQMYNRVRKYASKAHRAVLDDIQKLITSGALPAPHVRFTDTGLTQLPDGRWVTSAGNYYGVTHTISINPYATNDARLIADTYVHELLHALTKIRLADIEKQTDAKSRSIILQLTILKEIAESHSKEAGIELNYGFKDLNEFISMAFSDRQFQNFIINIKVPKNIQFNKPKGNIFKRFVGLIKGALGIKTDLSVLEATIAVTEDLIDHVTFIPEVEHYFDETQRNILNDRAILAKQAPNKPHLSGFMDTALKQVFNADRSITIRQFFLDPVEAFKNIPAMRAVVELFSNAELDMHAKISKGQHIVREATKGTSKKEREQLTTALYERMAGDKEAVNRLPEKLRSIAIRFHDVTMSNYQKRIKEHFIGQVIDSYKGGRQRTIKAVVNDGIPLNEAASKNRLKKTGIAAVQAGLDRIKELESWGLEDYVTHIEVGTYKVVMEVTNKDGKPLRVAIAIAKTRPAATEKAISVLQAMKKGGMTLPKELEITNEFTFSGESLNDRIIRSAAEHLDIDAKKLSAALRGRGIGITVKAGSRFAGPLIKRHGILRGEKDIFEALPTYIGSIEKKLAFDKPLRAAQKVLKSPEFSKTAKDAMENFIASVTGKYYLADQIMDSLLESVSSRAMKVGLMLGFEPRAYSRWTSGARLAVTNLKLGLLNPTKYIQNRLGGLQKIYALHGVAALLRAKKFARTAEGKKIWEDNKVRSGIQETLAVEAIRSMKGHKAVDIISKISLSLFQAAEIPNRREALLAGYLVAKDSGATELAAIQEGIDSVRMSQFLYNASSLPRILRSPSGKLIGQFKPYFFKELQFIANITPAQRGRYVMSHLLLGGPRAMIYMIKSLPLLGLLGWWDDIDEWLLKKSSKDKVSAAFAGGATAALTGSDMVPALVAQFPNELRDLAGPFLGDMWFAWTKIIEPAIRRGDIDKRDVEGLLKQFAPVYQYWNYAWEAQFNKDGWVTDDRGRVRFRPSEKDKVRYMLGMRPLRQAYESMARYHLGKKERVERDIDSRTMDKYLDAFEAGDVEAMDKLLPGLAKSGFSVGDIKRAARERRKPPLIRQMLNIKRARRDDAYSTIEYAEELERWALDYEDEDIEP